MTIYDQRCGSDRRQRAEIADLKRELMRSRIEQFLVGAVWGGFAVAWFYEGVKLYG